MLSDVAAIGFSANRVIAALGNPALRATRAVSPAAECDTCAPGRPVEKTRPTESTAPAEPVGKSELTEQEQREIEKLERRDAEVRRHEQAHKNAAGQYAKGGPTYEYKQGPDGKRYVNGGEVQIDLSEVPGDPDATVRKMQQVRRAALAPADPSSQDRQVAAKASSIEARARAEQAKQREGQGADLGESQASREQPAEPSDRAEPSRGDEQTRPTDERRDPPETVIFPQERGRGEAVPGESSPGETDSPSRHKQDASVPIEPPAPPGEPFGVAPRVDEMSPPETNLAPEAASTQPSGSVIASQFARLDAGLATLNAPTGRFIDVVV